MLVVEKDIEAYLKTRVEGLGGICLKFPTIYDEGYPDRILLLPGGRIIFAEVKRPHGGRLSELQKYRIAKLQALGFQAVVVKNYKEVDEVLNGITQG